VQIPDPGQRWIRRVSVAGHAEAVISVTTTANGVVLVRVQGRGVMTLDEFHHAYAWPGPALVFGPTIEPG